MIKDRSGSQVEFLPDQLKETGIHTTQTQVVCANTVIADRN